MPFFLILWGLLCAASFAAPPKPMPAPAGPPTLQQIAERKTPPPAAVVPPGDSLDLLKMSLDFVDTDIKEVLRTISAAYDISVLADNDVVGKVTVHLHNVGVLEGLEALCVANGFEVFRESSIFRIRKASEKTINILKMNMQRIDMDVQNRDVKEFIREFADKTGLKILAGSDLKGTVTGSWKNQIPLDGFKALMAAHGFQMRYKNGFWIVGSTGGASAGQVPMRNARAGTSDIEVKDGRASVNLENADLQEVLRSIAEQAKLNIVFYGEARETVNATIENATFDEVFSTILKGSKFTYVLTPEGTLLVGEKGARSALSTNVLYPLNHIKSETALKLIPRSLTEGGLQITEVKEQNALLLSGAQTEIENVRQFLTLIDVPTLQVLLECIIVEYNHGNQTGYGVSSGATKKAGAGVPALNVTHEFTGDATDLMFAGGNGKIGFLGSKFEFELSAMEQTNKAEVLARPSISTLNGNKATINVTNTMYYTVNSVSSDGYPIVDYRPFNDGISLEITPAVTQAGEITIDIAPEIKTSARSSGDGPRDISTRNLRTTVKLKDGQTVRLGGLIRTNTSKVREHVPFLGSIPLVGWLFSYHTTEEYTSELVIYITPRVLHEQTQSADVKTEMKNMKDTDSPDKVEKRVVR